MNPGVSRSATIASFSWRCCSSWSAAFVAYQQIGRLEDPEFTIKEALIITPYPGASAEEVAKEVTNPIETACQQLGQLERVESESTRGRSVVSADHPGPIPPRRHSPGLGRAAPQDRRRPTAVAACGARPIDGDRRFRRRLRHLSGHYRRRLFAAGAAPLRRVSAPRVAAGAERQEGRALRRAAGSRLPRNLAAAAGAARHQRGANLQQAPGEERRRRRRPRARRRPAHRASIRKADSARPTTCSTW